MLTASALNSYQYIFWDFDGVIKDSIPVKSDAFATLFSSFGNEIEQKVREHHESNGGMSRFEKIPLYLEWSKQTVTSATVKNYCDQFSRLVTDAVIKSPWVEGVQEFLRKYSSEKTFFLLTATPQREIEEILNTLQITDYFKEIAGAPSSKANAMGDILRRYTIDSEEAVMIGDSKNDYLAANEHGVVFILRKTRHNAALQSVLECQMINEFTE